MKYIYLLILAILIGILEYIFGNGLMLVSSLRDQHFFRFSLLLPIFALIMQYLFSKYGKNSKKGIKLLINKEHVPKRIIFFSTVMTWFSHLFGASVGREGVAVTQGGAIGYIFSKYIDLEKEDIIAIGMSVGFSSLFGLVISAPIFVMEILKINFLDYVKVIRIYFISFVLGIIGMNISSYLGLEHFSKRVNFDINFIDYFIYTILIILSICIGYLFSYILNFLRMKFSKLNQYYLIFFGSIVLVILLNFAHNGRYSGLGTNLIFNENIYSYDFILKLFFTVFSISIGFQGGEVTPLFSIGSSFGYIYSKILSIDPFVSMALGYVCVFGGATGALLSSAIILGEIFGYKLLIFFLPIILFKRFKVRTIYD